MAMNKRDILILVGLFALWLLWAPIDRMIIKPMFFPDDPAAETVEWEDEETPPEAVPTVDAPTVETEVEAPVQPVRDEAEEAPVEVLREPDAADVPTAELPAEVTPPARREMVETERMRVTFSSSGGTIQEMAWLSYPETDDDHSGPIILDFADQPALALTGIQGLSPRHTLVLQRLEGAEPGVLVSAELEGGLRFEREIRVLDDYVFRVHDRFINSTEQSLRVPAFGIHTGRMEPVPGATSMYGMFALGVDTLLPDGSLERLARDLHNRWMKRDQAPVIRQSLDTAADWIAVKNKYFTHSLRPHALDTENALVFAERIDQTEELAAVWATLQFPAVTLEPLGDVERVYTLYSGPQKIGRLKDLGYHQELIMELGFRPIRFFAGVLMIGLTGLYGIFGNYGVAIMLLTVIIRVLFWPLTHKGTESMRRMQELSPLMKELNEKYKDEPQKRQQAMMELYKEHKVNPLGGCFPMIVQIPVFIGLFYLLRTAIDLRFAQFLWISDLSEPERLLDFGFTVPFLGWDSLNILPIFMAFTMFLQQKMTPMPSSGDERQQQMHGTMMKVMPIMMLVMLYNFASGLALYWSTQNVLMIVQQSLHRRRRARQQAAGEGTVTPTAKSSPATKAHGAKAKGKKR